MALRVYLDTSVFSAYADDRLPERQRETREFWSRRRAFQLATSELARRELLQISAPQVRRRMLRLLGAVRVHALTAEMDRLAGRYLQLRVFSPAMRADALHVAAAVLTGHDVLLSWNFRHLVNVRRRAKVNEVNRREGLRAIEIAAPSEMR